LSLLKKVTCDPRATVSVWGQTALPTTRIVRVSGSVEQVSVGDGGVPLDWPPQAPAPMADARPAAAADLANTLSDVTRRS
jgi:hypothetical protein